MQKTLHYKHSLPDFSLDQVVVARYYDQDMERRIHRFKFANNHVDRVYFKELFSCMKEDFPPMGDVIVYPPISLRNRIFRGPNHAAYLAQYFSDHLDADIVCPFYKKIFSVPQSLRTREERATICHEYSLLSKFSSYFVNKKVIIVDDLITTGYTAHTLGKLLKNAGAQEVVGYFLASEKIHA